MNIETLIANVTAQRAAKLAERKTHTDLISNVRSVCETETRDPSDTEAAQVTAAVAARSALDAEIEALTGRLEGLQREKDADDAADRLSRETSAGAARPSYDGVARIGAEKRAYNPESDRTGVVFLRDVANQLRDPAASERLNRHMQEETVERSQYLNRASGTGAFAGLVVPQYLTEMYAPAAKAMRPFADACNLHSLPAEGMVVNISRITTATSAAVQSTENSAVSETNIDDTLLSPAVQTIAGQQTLSRQAIERGTGTEEVMLQDLIRAYATKVDDTLINQATTGLSAVATSVAYTDASPTAAELYPKFFDAQSQIEASVLDSSAQNYVAVMHSRRWAWIQSQVGTSFPFIGQPNLPDRNGGVNFGAAYGSNVRGLLPNGMPVIVDNNIATNKGVGTNEDEIYVVAANECHLWEDPSAPLMIRAEQTSAASLGVLFVVYGYLAYTFQRYSVATTKIGGTGLVTPTFA